MGVRGQKKLCLEKLNGAGILGIHEMKVSGGGREISRNKYFAKICMV